MRRISKGARSGVYIRWPVIFLFSLAALSAAHGALVALAGEEIREWGRIAFGVLAAVLVLFLSAYRVRKAALTVKLGSMEGWRQSHLYLGMICVALLLMHTNFKVYGNFGLLVAILVFFIIFSGMVGEILYRTVPVWLSKQGSSAQELELKRKSAAEYLTLADDATARASGEFLAFYGSRIRPLFATPPRPAVLMLMTERELAQRRKGIFDAFYAEGPATGRLALKNLEDIFTERDLVEFRWSKLLALRWWSMIHVPANAALVAALALHLLAVAYF